MNLTEVEVIAAHQAAIWQVAFCGFAYMTCDDVWFDLPPAGAAHPPAGSVALAGRFCGIYTQACQSLKARRLPGGVHISGRAHVRHVSCNGHVTGYTPLVGRYL